MDLWAWQFKDAQTTGVGRRIAMLEEGDDRADALKGTSVHEEGRIDHESKVSTCGVLR